MAYEGESIYICTVFIKSGMGYVFWSSAHKCEASLLFIYWVAYTLLSKQKWSYKHSIQASIKELI